MGFDIASLGQQPVLAQASERDARLVVTARLWVSLRKRGIDPAVAVSQRLGSEEAAWRFWLLMEEVGTAWPDPFMVSPPCCGRMSFDEASLIAMLDHARGGRRVQFLSLLKEMLPLEIADRLYGTARSFLEALPEPARVAGAAPN